MTLARFRLSGLAARTGVAAFLSAAFLVATAADSSAQVLQRGLQGAGLGAIIGGIAGGGKGAGKGAIAGGVAGAILGGIEASADPGPPPPPRGAPPPPPPRYSATPPPQPIAPPRANCSDLVRDIQRSLVKLGYDPGPIDCQYGNRTRTAIGAYQADHNLLVDGAASQQLLAHMLQNGG